MLCKSCTVEAGAVFNMFTIAAISSRQTIVSKYLQNNKGVNWNGLTVDDFVVAACGFGSVVEACLTESKQGCVIGLPEGGFSFRDIAESRGLNVSTAHDCWEQWSRDGTASRRPSSRRPRGTIEREDPVFGVQLWSISLRLWRKFELQFVQQRHYELLEIGYFKDSSEPFPFSMPVLSSQSSLENGVEICSTF
ncbi:uncharacterized protein TNCV_4263201 [Trichonephila clavipes]|nr:uncharacterized protein TNCV_4263201 [Trichonephila clavipes]